MPLNNGQGIKISPAHKNKWVFKHKRSKAVKCVATKKNITFREAIKIWQTSFYDFTIYSQEKYFQKLNYIHNNPVKAGLVKQAIGYTYSSISSYYCGSGMIEVLTRFGT